MRAWWRLFKVLAIVIGCTVYTDITARKKPRGSRLRFRVNRQVVAARLVCRAINIRVATRGRLPADIPMLFACNHLTALDPVLIVSQMPACFAGKVEIGRWPVLGWVCRAHGMLLVDRKHPMTTGMFIDQIRQRFASGVSLLVFPEGTTNWGNEVLEFKTGAFESVAQRNDGYVLPLFLNVTAVDGRPTAGDSGRHSVSHNHHNYLATHLMSLFGFDRVDFELHVGDQVSARAHTRKDLALLAHEAVSGLGSLADAGASSGSPSETKV